MKKIIVLLAALAAFGAASAQTIAPGLVSNMPVGNYGVQRADAQIEARNDGGNGHALVSIMQMVNPGVADREGALSFGAYDSGGLQRQLGSLSYQWANSAALGTGYAVARVEVNTVAGSGEVPLRLWGGQQGAVFFGDNGTPGDKATAGGPFVKIKRASGYPSIVGDGDIVIQGKATGGGVTYLNPYPDASSGSYGSVYIQAELTLADPTPWSCPAGMPAGVHHCKRFIDSDGAYSYWPVYR